MKSQSLRLIIFLYFVIVNLDVQGQSQPIFDYGDAPDPTYPTLLANDGARHESDAALPVTVFLGAIIDFENDGQPSAGGDGDDNVGSSAGDEDGIAFTSLLVRGEMATIEIEAFGSGLLNAWIDFNIDGDWNDPGEQIFTDESLVSGTNTRTINIPATATPGSTFARFRYDANGGLLPTGLAMGGEVEDYQVMISTPIFDYGDAPDPTYPTLLANDGARHESNSALPVPVFLGAIIDFENDGQPTASGDGDDNVGASAGDEDGITFTSLLVIGEMATIEIEAFGSGLLNAWIDFNIDGDWNDPGEQIFVDESLVSGTNTRTINIPATVTPGSTFARFRYDANGGLLPTGLAMGGEVEDYQVEVLSSAPPIPTLSQWGVMILLLMLVITGLLFVRSRAFQVKSS